MGIFDWLLGKPRKLGNEAAPGLNRGDRSKIDTLTRPALHLVQAGNETFSRLGGLPVVPADFVWPQWKEQPLAFLGQLSMAELAPSFPPDLLLARTGYLYFFYDQRQSTWGFDPEDRGSWRVIYVEGDPRDFVSAAKPVGLSEEVSPQKHLAGIPIRTFPGWFDDSIGALKLNESLMDGYFEMASAAYGGKPMHQMGGVAQAVQSNDMDLQCQLVSHGIYCGDPSGYNDPRVAGLEAGASDWHLLLQIDSDEEAGMMWGDVGILFFWIKKEDLRNRNFDAVWMVLQCS